MEQKEKELQNEELLSLLQQRRNQAETACWLEINDVLKKHKCRINPSFTFKDGTMNTLLCVEYIG